MSFTITFEICSGEIYKHEFLSNNLIKSKLRIKRVSILRHDSGVGGSLVLNCINNCPFTDTKVNSSLAYINQRYQSEYVDIAVNPTRFWELYLDTPGSSGCSATISLIVETIL